MSVSMSAGKHCDFCCVDVNPRATARVHSIFIQILQQQLSQLRPRNRSVKNLVHRVMPRELE